MSIHQLFHLGCTEVVKMLPLQDDNSVFLKIFSAAIKKSDVAKGMALLHPFNRKAVVCKHRYSSERLELALNSYRYLTAFDSFSISVVFD